MSNSMSGDYFSFMSEKSAGRTARTDARDGGNPRERENTLLDANGACSIPKSVQPTDVIDFAEEQSEIEVVESIVSDTMIQRIFRRFAKDEAA